MTKKKNLVEGTFQIMPSDINAGRHLYGAFNHNETEVSAGWIVRFFQERKTWSHFTLAEIQNFYTRPGRRPVDEKFIFNELVPRWIEKHGSNYYVTTDFISACYNASPANPEPLNLACCKGARFHG